MDTMCPEVNPADVVVDQSAESIFCYEESGMLKKWMDENKT